MMRASNYTRFAAGAAANSLVEGGGTVTVQCIACANTSASAETVLIEESDGSTVIQTIQVGANSTVVLRVPFLADKGIAVTAGGNTSVTVYHSKAGS